MSATGGGVDGVLHEWGARLFYGKVKPKGGPDESPLKPALQGAQANSKPIRAHIRSVVSPGGKQVMVKITGGGRGMAAIKAHMRYISRQGKDEVGGPGETLELEDENGQVLKGKEAMAELAQDWRVAGTYIHDDSPRKEAFNIILSMPEGTPAEAVLGAARDFARETFEGHKYVFVLHTDTGKPHVHLAVRTERSDGIRLNPRKADLQRWRERYAARLQDRGINALATPARARGATRSSQPTWRTKSAQRVRRPKAALRSGPGHDRSRAEALQAWSEIQSALKGSPDAADRELGKEVEQYMRQAFADVGGRTDRMPDSERGAPGGSGGRER